MVEYGVAGNMNMPNPDPGEEYQHVNTQLFGIVEPEANRGVLAERMVAPFNAPRRDSPPTMDGFVADYISAFTAEMGRPPTYDEYAQIMTGYTPEQMPVFSALARGSRCSTTGSARCPRRPSPTDRSSTRPPPRASS